MVANARARSKLANTRRRFAAALRLAGLTQVQWAEKQGISWGHLSHVLSGRRVSNSLVERVERWSNETIAAAQPAALSA